MFTKITITLFVIMSIYIGILQFKISGLNESNDKLNESLVIANNTVASRDKTIEALKIRETENKKIEVEYEKAIELLKKEKSGPVSDVIRRAIATDIVR